MRFIIDVKDDIPPCQALRRVADVVSEGRVSEAGRGEAKILHYCWLTKFINGVEVMTRRKKVRQGSDSFIVQKTIEQLEREEEKSSA